MKSEHWLFVAALALLAFFSLYKLTESPPLWFDEGIYTQAAMNLAQGNGQLIQTAPHTFAPSSYLTVGYPLLLPVAISYKLFGVGVVQGRAVMVLFILALGIMAYLLIRKMNSPTPAFLALFLLATYPSLYGDGKTVIGEVPGLFFLFCSLYALLHLERNNFKDWRGYVAVGVAAGLCAATKPMFILFLIALFFAYIVRFKSISLSAKGVVACVVALVLPLVLWVYLQFGADASVHAIVLMYANPSGVTDVWLVMRQNALRFFTETTPMYAAFLMVVWATALWLRRKSETISNTELAAFFFSVLIMPAYLRMDGGWYRYLFPAMIVAMPFLPHSLKTIADRLKFKGIVPATFIILLVLAQAYQTIHSSFVAEYYGSTRTQDLTAVLTQVGSGSKVLLYNAPDAAILLPTRNYSQYLKLSAQVTLGTSNLEQLSGGAYDVVLVPADQYTQTPAQFSKYKISHAVNQYDLLVKK